jgi:hypothetical protein
MFIALSGSHRMGNHQSYEEFLKKERAMKVETIVIKEFQEIVDELKEVLSRLSAGFAVDEFFPL